MPTESFATALRDLDPASRALLDLSLRRGMRPEEIAEMLGADEETVVTSRDQALDQLASELGARDDQLDDLRARLAELPPEDWTGMPRKPTNGAVPIAAGPKSERSGGRSRSRPLVLLLLLAVAGIIVVIALAAGGGSKSKSGSQAVTPAPVHTGPPATAPVVAVGSGAAGATGAATVSGDTLKLTVKGLPAPHGGAKYEIWLYNSVIDAKPLGSTSAAQWTFTAKLPPDARRYRFVDVSYEPNDGNPSHSGASVVRVPVAPLLKR